MYKKQLAFQKFACLLAMVSSVAVFIYSLGIMTDLYDSLYSTMTNPYDLTQTTVPGSIVYYDMQTFNQMFTRGSIGLILISCLLFITNTHSRRKYYIGNVFSTLLFAGANIYMTIWAHDVIEYYKARFLKVDFEALKRHAEIWKTTYTESTFWFDLHYIIFGVVLVAVLFLLINLIWKFGVMKAEKKLIKAGKEVAA